MRVACIDRNIVVAVVFGPGNRLRPVWFGRGRKKHTITEVTYTWKAKIGGKTVLHFAVSDGTALYELAYDSEAQRWSLSGIEVNDG